MSGDYTPYSAKQSHIRWSSVKSSLA